MLYRTHHHPFPHSSLSSHFLSSSSHPQAMEPGLKTSDDFLVVSGDDLFVDEFLDFSNGFDEEVEPQEQDDKEQGQNMTSPTVPENSCLSLKDDFGSIPESELSAPVEGLESLEWLSHFTDDSFSSYSLTGKLPPKPTAAMAREQPCFAAPVQTKARTKRARTGVRVWPVLSESSTSSSSSSSSTTTSFCPWPVLSQTGESFLGKAVKMKQKKKPAEHSSAAQPRRCSHCGVTKTPQWRAGPLGSKTLCNACGVRFKSGRLLPEYRPACSPTFSTELHSNNHRKVLEMRRKKESETDAGPMTAAVHSF